MVFKLTNQRNNNRNNHFAVYCVMQIEDLVARLIAQKEFKALVIVQILPELKQ